MSPYGCPRDWEGIESDARAKHAKALEKRTWTHRCVYRGHRRHAECRFFLMPGLAAEQVGSAIVLAYLLAAIPLIPAMFSIVELATAMPRAGGVYYFLDRTFGPLVGTIGGLGT